MDHSEDRYRTIIDAIPAMLIFKNARLADKLARAGSCGQSADLTDDVHGPCGDAIAAALPPTTTTTTTTTTTVSTTSTVPQPTPVEATTLRLKDRLTGLPNATSFSFSSSTRDAAPANRIVPPPRLGASDPTLPTTTPVTLVFYNSAGRTSDKEFYTLDYRGWRYLGSSTNPKGYSFRLARVGGGGPVRSVTVRTDKITAKGTGLYSLNESSQGRIAVRLYLGSIPWCADAPARLTGHPPSSASTDRPGHFEGQPRTPAPALCPAIP